ncbi:DUF1294 domain-containing protein [Pseudomonas mosselii]|uniref:DUF1294 domain-containing protein n=1 Tax=Pseudomonas mosselii TaxID=78327 RepID=UPI00244B7584|nr:DUF1294 domain-containing protein [Pseudomonas mosselii]MDH1658732.1 DUF1294 domain-containing protein [Pseudomonas mosselii]MDH1717078.1 DUF1294 domain-containing protein [Pseudomonas mosselii]MDH1722419.1 DUF1294 domain-containing protein [Pseudomonas mosselii]
MARRQNAPTGEAGIRHLRLKVLMLVGLCLLPVFGGVQMGLGGRTWLPLAMYLAASLVSLLLYWQDKQQARSQAWRTPEKVLHASELLGGWPGALVAQQLFRHKTRKVSYQAVFWGIVLLHQVFWVDYLFLAGRWSKVVI